MIVSSELIVSFNNDQDNSKTHILLESATDQTQAQSPVVTSALVVGMDCTFPLGTKVKVTVEFP